MVSSVVARYVDALSAPQISVGVGWSTAVTRGNAPPDDQSRPRGHFRGPKGQGASVDVKLSKVRSLERRT